MNMDSIIYIISLIVLIYLSARFAGAETALTALSKLDLAQMKLDEVKHVDMLVKLKSDMDRTIITVLIGNNLVNITASAIATKFSYDLWGNLGVSIAVGVLTILILIFAEITPKGFAIKNRKKFCKKNAAFIYYMSIIVGPLISALSHIADFIIYLTGGQLKSEHIHITESDVRDLASILEEEGVIKEIEKDILHNVFWFGDVRVKKVKVPKEKTFVLDSKITLDEGVEFIKEHGFTRIPVSEHGSEKIIGILYSKDLLGEERGKIKDFVREVPMFVKNEDDATEVFQAMKKKRVHMAIVKDDDEKFDGIITLEDTLEELLGEIYDEFDRVKN